MNRSIATTTQWVGRITVLVALAVLIWSWYDIANANGSPFGSASFGPNQYLFALSQSTGLAVSGMFAIGLGMMLERFDRE